jgi:hypothetical protein
MQNKMQFSLLQCHPYTSHKLQAYCTIFGPYKTYYSAYLNVWMLPSRGKRVNIYIALGIIGKYFNKSFAKHNIEKGIHVTGIYPLNGNSVDENEFYPPMLLTEFSYSQVAELVSSP